MGISARTLKVGENMAKRVLGYARGGENHFRGSLQRFNGKTVCQGRITGLLSGDVAYTKISMPLPNGGLKSVSRAIPTRGGLQTNGDLTKITTVQNAKVGGKNVQTVNKEIYKYGANNLCVSRIQKDSFSGGRRIMSRLPNYSPTKEFYDANNKLLKTVCYDEVTGLRTLASLPDGRVIRYDAKGLPLPTNAYTTGAMDLGGLDRLI